MSESPIISGTLQDLDLSVVMDVTCLGRQTLRLEVTSASGAMIGFVVLKAGRIISAEAGVHRGPAALAVILNAEAHARFRVVRDATDAKSAAAFAMVGEPLDFSRAASELFAEGTEPKIRVMEGSLGDFDVPTLLQTIGMGRTFVEVDVLSEAGQPIGSVILKAGKIMAARAGSFEGLQAVRELLDSPKNFQFAVFRIDEQSCKGLQNADPVGGLGQVLMDAQPRAHRPTRPLHINSDAEDRTPIMSGLLSDFDVPTLLQTLGAGRQYVGLEVLDRGFVVGTIMIKAAMVMTAAAGDLTGMPAFRKLVRSPASCGFNVYRKNSVVPQNAPLGPMHVLLMTAMEPEVGRRPSRNPPADDRVAVMSGHLTDFGVATLLETLTQNRQHTLVEFIRNNRVFGSIHLKAGMVCAARAGEQVGVPAFHALVAAPPDGEFCVFRTQAVDVSMPLGPLSDLLRGDIWAANTTVSSIPAEPESRPNAVATETTRAKRSHGPWIGAAIFISAIAAALLWVWWPQAPVEAPVVGMSVEPILPADRPSVPVDEPIPAAPAPPLEAQPVPKPPAPPATEAPPVQPVPPVLEAKPHASSPSPEPLRRMSTRTAQSMLAKLGYPVGPIDNIYGPRTRAALSAFQTAEGLDATGALTPATIRALMAK